MHLLELEELNLLVTFLGLDLLSFSISFLDGLDLGFELADFVLELGFFVFKSLDGLLKICLSMLGLKLFSHGKGDGTLIKSLISSDGHLDLVSNSKEEKSSFWLTKSYLSNNFIKALGEEFFSYWADTTLSSLSFHKLLIEHLSESGNIDS